MSEKRYAWRKAFFKSSKIKAIRAIDTFEEWLLARSHFFSSSDPTIRQAVDDTLVAVIEASNDPELVIEIATRFGHPHVTTAVYRRLLALGMAAVDILMVAEERVFFNSPETLRILLPAIPSLEQIDAEKQKRLVELIVRNVKEYNGMASSTLFDREDVVLKTYMQHFDSVGLYRAVLIANDNVPSVTLALETLIRRNSLDQDTLCACMLHEAASFGKVSRLQPYLHEQTVGKVVGLLKKDSGLAGSFKYNQSVEEKWVKIARQDAVKPIVLQYIDEDCYFYHYFKSDALERNLGDAVGDDQALVALYREHVKGRAKIVELLQSDAALLEILQFEERDTLYQRIVARLSSVKLAGRCIAERECSIEKALYIVSKDPGAFLSEQVFEQVADSEKKFVLAQLALAVHKAGKWRLPAPLHTIVTSIVDSDVEEEIMAPCLSCGGRGAHLESYGGSGLAASNAGLENWKTCSLCKGKGGRKVKTSLAAKMYRYAGRIEEIVGAL